MPSEGGQVTWSDEFLDWEFSRYQSCPLHRDRTATHPSLLNPETASSLCKIFLCNNFFLSFFQQYFTGEFVHLVMKCAFLFGTYGVMCVDLESE